MPRVPCDHSPFSAPVCERPAHHETGRLPLNTSSEGAVSKRNTHLKLLFKSLGAFQEHLIALGFVGEIYIRHGERHGEWVNTIFDCRYMLYSHDQPFAGFFDWHLPWQQD